MYFLPVDPFWTNLSEIFIQEIQLENVICKMAATLSRHQIQGNKRNQIEYQIVWRTQGKLMYSKSRQKEQKWNSGSSEDMEDIYRE